MASVELTRAQLGGEALISAFVATRSRSKKCLLTLAESSAAAPSTAAFCGYRRYRGANGVIVRIYLATPAPADLRMTVTVYHEGAKRYGKPILYVG